MQTFGSDKMRRVDNNTGAEMCADVCGGFWWDSSNSSEMFELLMMQETFVGRFLCETQITAGDFVCCQ